MIKFFKKRKYEVKYFLYFTVIWSDLDKLKETVTYMLLENGRGQRQVEIKSYGSCKSLNREKTFSLYREVILPWLSDIDEPLEDFRRTSPQRVVARDNDQIITVEEKGKILYINRDKK